MTDSLRVGGSCGGCHVRHEEAAAFAAGAEAAVTGRARGLRRRAAAPATHLINGLFDCPARPRARPGDRGAHPAPRDRHHIFPGDRSAATCSPSAAISTGLVSQPEQMPRLLEIAIRTALSRPGVAVLVSPATSPCAPHVARRHPPSRRGADRPAALGRRRAARLPRPERGAQGDDPRPASAAPTRTPSSRARRHLAGADRARDARQGLHRVRQPLRRRDAGLIGFSSATAR